MKYNFLKMLNGITKNSSRIMLGVIFLAYGLNSVLNFFSTPTPPPQSHDFLLGLASAPYFFPLLKGLEILCGLALLTGRYTKLALVVLTPIVVNIALFHGFLDHSLESLVMPSIMFVLYLHVLWQNRKDLKYLLER